MSATTLSPTSTSYSPTYQEKRCITLVNRSRADKGLSALKLSSRLSYWAHEHSRFMASKGTIFHTTTEHMYTRYGAHLAWKALGENVGAGPSVDAIHKAFLASPEHRANILGKWSHLGAGVVKKGDIYYVTQAFFLA